MIKNLDSHNITVLYPNLCYMDVIYKETELYSKILFLMNTYPRSSPPVSFGGFHLSTALSLLSSLTNSGPWGRLGGPTNIHFSYEINLEKTLLQFQNMSRYM